MSNPHRALFIRDGCGVMLDAHCKQELHENSFDFHVLLN